MNSEQKELLREFEHLNWGTGMPVTLMVGGDVVSIRGWGSCALEAANLALFEAAAADVDELRGRVKSYLPMRLADVLADASMSQSSLDELCADRAGLEAGLKLSLELDFVPMGLAVRQVVIDSLNSI